MKQDPDLLPIRWDRPEQGVQIRRSHNSDSGSVKVRRKRHTCKGSVTAVTPTHDRDTLWIRDALADEVLDAPRYVVLHLVAPLVVPGIQKLLSISGRRAEVRRQDCVTAIRQKLGHAVVSPVIPAPWPAMRYNHQRKIFFRQALRQRQVRWNLQAIR